MPSVFVCYSREDGRCGGSFSGITPEGSHALMACGCQMASWAFQRELAALGGLSEVPVRGQWPFVAMLEGITSTAPTTARREELLAALRAGSQVRL